MVPVGVQLQRELLISLLRIRVGGEVRDLKHTVMVALGGGMHSGHHRRSGGARPVLPKVLDEPARAGRLA